MTPGAVVLPLMPSSRGAHRHHRCPRFRAAAPPLMPSCGVHQRRRFRAAAQPPTMMPSYRAHHRRRFQALAPPLLQSRRQPPTLSHGVADAERRRRRQRPHRRTAPRAAHCAVAGSEALARVPRPALRGTPSAAACYQQKPHVRFEVCATTKKKWRRAAHGQRGEEPRQCHAICRPSTRRRRSARRLRAAPPRPRQRQRGR